MIRPINDYFVVKLEELTKTTEGGIILVNTLTTEHVTGTILAVGPGKDRPLSVKPGDKVLLTKGSGQEVIINKEKFQLCTEPNIIGIID